MTDLFDVIEDSELQIFGVIEDAELQIFGVIEDAELQINVQLIEGGIKGDPGEPGTTNYNLLENRPSIQSIELIGNRTFEELGITPISQEEILNIL